MPSEVQQAQQELVDEFALFEDWMDRYQYLIDLGRRLPGPGFESTWRQRFAKRSSSSMIRSNAS